MTEDMKIAFEALCSKTENTDIYNNGEVWGSVYLDNAKPNDWSGKKWSGVLSALAKAGLYKDEDHGFKGEFGRVKVA